MTNSEELLDGTGATVALTFQIAFSSIGAFVVLIIISPYLFLCFLGFIFITYLILGLVIFLYVSHMQGSKKAYGQANGYADQALSSMKVVQTYGREMLEIKNYDKYLLHWYETKSKGDWVLGIGIGVFVSFTFLQLGCQFIIGS